MRAWVIKTKTGYVGYAGNKHKLNEAALYSTKENAEEDNIHKDKTISIEIKLTKGKKRKKKKRKVKIHYRTIHETIACGRSFISDTFTSAIVKRKVTCDACRNTIEFRKRK